MIIRDRAQALFDVFMDCDHEEAKFDILHEMAFAINCSNCPVLSSCKEKYECCAEYIGDYLEGRINNEK